MRARSRLAVATLPVAGLILALQSGSPAKPPGDQGRSPSASTTVPPPRALLDSLMGEMPADSVEALISRSLRKATEAKDSVLVGNWLVTRGLLEMRGRSLSDALATLERAIEWSQAARDTARWLESMRFTYLGQSFQGRRAEAMQTAREMLELAMSAGDPVREAWARVGIAYMSLLNGDPTTARDEYTEAIRLLREDGEPRDELVPLVGLGRVYSRLGEIDRSRACFQRVWLVASESGNNIQAGDALNNLGTLEHTYGDPSGAIDYYERALTHYRAAQYTAGEVTAASNIGLAQQQLGRYSAAADIFTVALQKCKTTGMRAHAGMLLNNLGATYLRSHRFRRAESLFRRASAMGDTLNAKGMADATLGLGQALAHIDSVEAAVAVLQRGLSVGNAPPQQAGFLLDSARYLRRLGRTEEALAHALRARSLTKSFTKSQMRAVALSAVSTCYRENGMPDSAYAVFNEFLVAADSVRAVTSTDTWRVAVGHWMNEPTLSAAPILLEYPPGATAAERRERMFDVLQRFKARTLTERIVGPSGRTEPVRGEAPEPSLQRIQQSILEKDDLLLEFFVSEQWSWLFAVTRDSLRLVTLPGYRSGLAERVADFTGMLGRASGTPSPEDLFPARLALGRSLFGGVTDLVAGAKRLVVIPDGFLHVLPFGALVLTDGEDGSSLQLTTKDIYRVPSTAYLDVVLSRRDGAGSSHDGLLIVAGVGPDGERLAGVEREASHLRKQFANTRVVREVVPATFADEARSATVLHIAGHVDVNDERPWHSGILVSAAHATSAAPRENTASDALSILTREDSVSLRQSLAPAAYLRASHIASMSLPARLAVLSGCESALGGTTLGEGVIGLGAAFMTAGVSTVVASLWPVDDRTTADFMRIFYDGLASGLTVAAATREARAIMRSRSATRHPFHWAGFVVIGDGGASIRLPSRVASHGLAAVVVVALVLLGSLLLWRGRKWSKKTFTL